MKYKKEVEEMLKKWDAGETIWSIELGGMGPGYEQAIQIAAVEFARASKGLEGLKANDKQSTDKFRDCCNEALKKFDNDVGGITGAQFGAATWLAWQWCEQVGPLGLQTKMKSENKTDRAIQISNLVISRRVILQLVLIRKNE